MALCYQVLLGVIWKVCHGTNAREEDHPERHGAPGARNLYVSRGRHISRTPMDIVDCRVLRSLHRKIILTYLLSIIYMFIQESNCNDYELFWGGQNELA
jgi:hypothetical protein